MRTVVWFSCGACSTLALEYALKECGNVVAVYCDTGGEHPDNQRYLQDVENRYGIKAIRLKNGKYKDHFDVYEKTKFLISPQGARCTGELKKRLRYEFQLPDDIHIFGYSADEKHRAERLNSTFPELTCYYPLITHGITKKEAIGYLWRQGLELPVMYKMGYKNNNCIGCVKGGMGYWNKIKRDFPEQFNRMAKIERELNIKINKVFLDELKGMEGNYQAEMITCDFTCQNISEVK